MIFKPLLKSALGEEPCDLLFKNARFANLCTMEYETGDIAVKDGVIVGIGAGYEAKETVDCTGRLLLPGFIEGHMHVESTFMTPVSYTHLDVYKRQVSVRAVSFGRGRRLYPDSA